MAALSLYVHILVEIIAASSKLYIKKDDYPMLNEGFGCLSAKLNSSIREIFKKMDFSNTVN